MLHMWSTYSIASVTYVYLNAKILINTSLKKNVDVHFEFLDIFGQLLDPKHDIQLHSDKLLSTVRLLVSEDQCDGRFVYGRRLPAPSKKATKEMPPGTLLKGGGGGDNAKTQLQTLLVRAGHEAPIYKTKQLKNNQFRSTVIFNGLDFMGQPFGSKKLAEKDAAGEALLWLRGENHSTSRDIDHMSVLLKKSKKKKQSTSIRGDKWG